MLLTQATIETDVNFIEFVPNLHKTVNRLLAIYRWVVPEFVVGDTMVVGGTKILLNHLNLLLGEEIGRYVLEVANVIEYSLGLSEVFIHVVEVVKDNIAPIGEAIEWLGTFAHDALIFLI